MFIPRDDTRTARACSRSCRSPTTTSNSSPCPPTTPSTDFFSLPLGSGRGCDLHRAPDARRGTMRADVRRPPVRVREEILRLLRGGEPRELELGLARGARFAHRQLLHLAVAPRLEPLVELGLAGQQAVAFGEVGLGIVGGNPDRLLGARL